MAPPKHAQRRRRWRLSLAWGLSIALVGGYLALGESGDESSGPAQIGAPAKPVEEQDLEITEVIPAEAVPGSAIEVWFVGQDPKSLAPMRAFLSGKEEIEIVHASGDHLVVLIPKTSLPGRNKLRIQQGAESRSKPYDIRIKTLNRRKQLRSVFGGMALLIFGLRLMSRGSRAFAGQRGQGLLARIGRRTPAAVGLGVLVGGITQFTTTAAGLVVGLVESHIMAVAPAVAILLGAQLGAAAAPSVLGLASTREGLLVVTVGVVWLTLAVDRRSESIGKVILGCGLLFYGLHLLRQGFEPLVSDPAILPYIGYLRADTIAGTLTCVLAGTALAALLQSPSPVFVLVLGLAQSTGRVDLQSALAILSGTGLGAAMGTVAVSWPFGADARRVARTHLVLALAGTLILAATIDAWAFVADSVVKGEPHQISYGKKILLPHIGGHLLAGFALSQMAVTVILAALLAPLSVILQKIAPAASAKPPSALSGAEGTAALRVGLGRVLAGQRAALVAITDLCLTGHRHLGRQGEHTLADARTELEGLFRGALRAATADGNVDFHRLRQGALATVQLQRALEELLGQAERATEKKMALSPAGENWQVGAREESTLKAVHRLVADSLESVINHLSASEVLDIDGARAREIRLNAIESDARQGIIKDSDQQGQGPQDRETSRLIRLRLNNTDIVDAYESVGNHLYRLQETLATEADEAGLD